MVDENINSIMIMTLKEKTFFIAVSKRRVTGCSTDPEYHFPNIKYLMNGYNVLSGYPLSKTGDPGFYRKIFETNYEGDVSDDCG